MLAKSYSAYSILNVHALEKNAIKKMLIVAIIELSRLH